MKYYVVEFQTSGASGAALPYVFDNRPDAEAKYYTVMSAAAKSPVEKHGALIITEDLFTIKGELAYREAAPEPTPVDEVNE